MSGLTARRTHSQTHPVWGGEGREGEGAITTSYLPTYRLHPRAVQYIGIQVHAPLPSTDRGGQRPGSRRQGTCLRKRCPRQGFRLGGYYCPEAALRLGPGPGPKSVSKHQTSALGVREQSRQRCREAWTRRAGKGPDEGKGNLGSYNVGSGRKEEGPQTQRKKVHPPYPPCLACLQYQTPLLPHNYIPIHPTTLGITVYPSHLLYR